MLKIKFVNHKGFTLFELVLTILLIVILSSFTFSYSFKESDFKQSFELQKVLFSLRHAQKLSYVTECEVKVELINNEFQFFRRKSCTEGNFSIVVNEQSGEKSRLIASLEQRVDSIKHLFPIYFTPKGSVLNKNRELVKKVELFLVGQKLVIDGLTGFVYIDKS